MTNILLIRHGESMANKYEIFCGQSDYDLTETGFEQARVTANYIAQNYQVACVYASDLLRAFHTGETIGAMCHCPVVPDKNLREIHCRVSKCLENCSVFFFSCGNCYMAACISKQLRKAFADPTPA